MESINIFLMDDRNKSLIRINQEFFVAAVKIFV